MEPVEINAGQFYLRRLRADDRIDDRQAIVESFADPELRRWADGLVVPDLAAADAYIARRVEDWAADRRCSWAVADQLDVGLVGVVELRLTDPRTGVADASCWTRPGARGTGVASGALAAVLNFGFHGLGLRTVVYRHAASNTASRRVAEKCGFTLTGRLTGATTVEDIPCDLLIWSRGAGDEFTIEDPRS
jgi:RimJ/RimL family protein N-acetyltransferase